MPYKDRDRKLASMKEWRKRVMPMGYGKWLYAKRKLRFQDADEFRKVLEEIAEAEYSPTHALEEVMRIKEAAREVLVASRQREEELGSWEPPTVQNLDT